MAINQSSGEIVAVGYAINYTVNVDDFLVVCYTSAGTLDHNFNPPNNPNQAGIVTTDFGGEGAAACSVAIKSNGEIVVVGYDIEPTPGNQFAYYDFALACYTTNGTLDTSFGATTRAR